MNGLSPTSSAPLPNSGLPPSPEEGGWKKLLPLIIKLATILLFKPLSVSSNQGSRPPRGGTPPSPRSRL